MLLSLGLPLAVHDWNHPPSVLMADQTDSMAFSGKVITITGAARGIGFATAKYLAARGATVSLADALHEELSKAHESLSASFPESRIRHAVVNVSNRDEVEEWLAKTKDEFDKINGCLNNAGKFSD